jgi:predicted transcriptional regulator
MRFSFKKITIIRFNKEPEMTNIDQELQWLGTSLGLFSLRDKDRSAYRVFITLLKALKTGNGLTSDEIAFQLNLTRGTVIHHINNLLSAGIVIEKNNRYQMREKTMKKILLAMKLDMEKTYDNMITISEKIDEKLDLN